MPRKNAVSGIGSRAGLLRRSGMSIGVVRYNEVAGYPHMEFWQVVTFWGPTRTLDRQKILGKVVPRREIDKSGTELQASREEKLAGWKGKIPSIQNPRYQILPQRGSRKGDRA